MRFIGIDLGWLGKPTGLAHLEWNGRRLHLTDLHRLASHQEVLEHVPSNQPTWIAIDAPVLITNKSGTRNADRICTEIFASQHAGCYPINLGLPFAGKVLQLIHAIQAKGYSTEVPQQPQSQTSHLFEVYPHAASIRLFNLPQILKYKKGPKATRLQALTEYRQLLATQLNTRRPNLTLKHLPPTGQTLTEMKACEDQLDAVLCAYIAAHYWYWGAARNNILGHPPTGFIVNPSF